MTVLVENLTVRVWLLTVWPVLLRRRLAGDRGVTCHIVDASPAALRFAKWIGSVTGLTIERLSFRLIDVRDEAGLLTRLRLQYRDLGEIQKEIVQEPMLMAFLSRGHGPDRLMASVVKAVATMTLGERATLWRLVLLVHVAAWQRRTGAFADDILLVAERRPWSKVLNRYANRHRIQLLEVQAAVRPRALIQRALGQRVIAVLRAVRNTVAHRRSVSSAKPAAAVAGGRHEVPGGPRIAVSYHGQFNLDDPSRYSDLFFWQQSQLSARDILLLFEFPQDPLDAEKWRVLQRLEIAALSLYPGASEVAEVPLFTHVPSVLQDRHRLLGVGGWSLESRWLRQAAETHLLQREYWAKLFEQERIKLYITWYRYDEKHFAIADALESVGGITAIYQRAHQPDPTPEITVNADVMFGYSTIDAEVERRSGSVIPYHVAVGYFGDHRFPMLTEAAAAVRQSLARHGATYVVAYFDENSGEDSRWHTGHEFMRDNFVFLLEKIFEDSSLGIVFKPKYPSNLRRRLGPVLPLLERAIATGRCYIYEEGPLHGVHPPAVAAMAADVAIHGHLCAATAGLEAALAGTPTLLLDREGWGVSEMYDLGVGRVVFSDWDSLWKALSEQRVRPGAVPGFGDWSPRIERYDPFRDGRGAERIGTYLTWLLDGFKAGLDRERVLSDAAERYAARWGHDKVTAVNSAPRAGAFANDPVAALGLPPLRVH